MTRAKAAPRGAKKKKKPAARKPVRAKPSTRRPGSRSDYGAPTDGFFARQPAHLRPILDELRTLVQDEAPDSRSSLKWGMPFYSVIGNMICALGAHKSHVNLILFGPSSAYRDPEGRLSGAGKMGRHLKLTRIEDLPRREVRQWLRTALAVAGKMRR
jgi:hypothetical protein